MKSWSHIPRMCTQSWPIKLILILMPRCKRVMSLAIFTLLLFTLDCCINIPDNAVWSMDLIYCNIHRNMFFSFLKLFGLGYVSYIHLLFLVLKDLRFSVLKTSKRGRYRSPVITTSSSNHCFCHCQNKLLLSKALSMISSTFLSCLGQ